MQIGEQKDGINYLSDIDTFAQFRDLYLKVRLKERRILDDNVVEQLPYITKQMSVHFKEWKTRARSFEQLRQHVNSSNRPLALMDLGCGNGWMAARLAKSDTLKVSAVDVNVEELKQGARIFQQPNLAFYYGNIFDDIFPQASFDFIVLNACAQYFENIQALIERLFFFLKKDGEIHIIDTPFYTKTTIESAKQRTQSYYNSIGFEKMAMFYHHHALESLSPFSFEVLSSNNLWSRIYASLRGVPISFQWIKIKKIKRSQ